MFFRSQGVRYHKTSNFRIFSGYKLHPSETDGPDPDLTFEEEKASGFFFFNFLSSFD